MRFDQVTHFYKLTFNIHTSSKFVFLYRFRVPGCNGTHAAVLVE